MRANPPGRNRKRPKKIPHAVSGTLLSGGHSWSGGHTLVAVGTLLPFLPGQNQECPPRKVCPPLLTGRRLRRAAAPRSSSVPDLPRCREAKRFPDRQSLRRDSANVSGSAFPCDSPVPRNRWITSSKTPGEGVEIAEGDQARGRRAPSPRPSPCRRTRPGPRPVEACLPGSRGGCRRPRAAAAGSA